VQAYDEWAIACVVTADDHPHMKRIAAAPLWFLLGWFVGSVVAWTFDLNGLLAPTIALLLAGFVVGDPAGLFWSENRAVRERAKERLSASSAHN
jgi:hypothetical protein